MFCSGRLLVWVHLLHHMSLTFSQLSPTKNELLNKSVCADSSKRTDYRCSRKCVETNDDVGKDENVKRDQFAQKGSIGGQRTYTSNGKRKNWEADLASLCDIAGERLQIWSSCRSCSTIKADTQFLRRQNHESPFPITQFDKIIPQRTKEIGESSGSNHSAKLKPRNNSRRTLHANTQRQSLYLSPSSPSHIVRSSLDVLLSSISSFVLRRALLLSFFLAHSSSHARTQGRAQKQTHTESERARLTRSWRHAHHACLQQEARDPGKRKAMKLPCAGSLFSCCCRAACCVRNSAA